MANYNIPYTTSTEEEAMLSRLTVEFNSVKGTSYTNTQAITFLFSNFIKTTLQREIDNEVFKFGMLGLKI